MAAELLTDLSRATDANSNPLAGAKWYFYATGTTTPLSVYTTAALNVAHANPVVADSGGQFAPIYFDAEQIYRGVLKTAAGATLRDIDPINPGIINQLGQPGGSNAIGFLQAGTGAVARTAQEKLREIEVSSSDYGVVVNDEDPAVAVANYTAIRTALAYCLSEGTGLGEGGIAPYLEGHLPLSFPAGFVLIDGNSPLMFNRTQMVALPGAYRYRRGFGYIGRGKNSTILELTSSGVGNRWFWSNYDAAYTGNPAVDQGTSVADYVTFKGITFRGNPSHASLPSIDQTNGLYLEAYGFEKFFEFHSCKFESLDKIVHVEGTGNADHNRFYHCVFHGIREYCFYFNNDQAVSWGLYGCDAEGISGRVISIGPKGGGQMSWDGGSITLYPELDEDGVALPSQDQKAFLWWDNSGVTTGPTSGAANGKYTFRDLRFEIYSESQALVVAKRTDPTTYGAITVIFQDCIMPMVFTDLTASEVADLHDTVILENNATVIFDSCEIHESMRFRCVKHSPNIYFKNCMFLNNSQLSTEGLAANCFIEEGCTGTIQARGTRLARPVINEYDKMLVSDFNMGACSMAPPEFSVQGKDPNANWPQEAYWPDLRVYLPEGTSVLGFVINKPAESVGSPTANCGFEVKDHAGTSLWATTTTSVSQNDAIVEQGALEDVWVAPASPNNYLVLDSKGDNVTTPWLKKSIGQWIVRCC